MSKRLTNLRVPAGGNTTRAAEIVVEDGRIAAIGTPGEAPAESDAQVVDLEGLLVLPGVIDGHVHFDDPGFTHREDFETGTRAAAAGGVTCVVDMPCTSLPPVTSRDNLLNKLEVIARKAHVDFMLWGGVSGNAMREEGWRAHLEELADEGVASIKVYLLSGMDTFRDVTRAQMAEVLRETRRLGLPVGVHAEDRDMVHRLESDLRSRGGDAPRDYAASRPSEAEISAVETVRDLCRETGASAHIVHISSGGALDVVSEARKEGLRLTAETCPHFLAFTAEDLDEQGALLKTAPVVKSGQDRDRLWEGLRSMELDFVATDHAAGQWPQEKHTGSIWTDYGGVPGVEISLPYLFSEGVRAGRIDLERLTEVTASAPARFFGIGERKGRIAVGLDADLVALDESETWTVRAEELHNKNRYTPLEGHELTGRVRATYVRGERVYERGAGGSESFGAMGHGRRVRRESRLDP
ncbi:MAG: allantoinase AllB [Longimicrobiales bacterium]